MTDNATVRYRLFLLKETVVVALTIIAIRLHLVTVSLEERYKLKQRRDNIRTQIEKIRSNA